MNRGLQSRGNVSLPRPFQIVRTSQVQPLPVRRTFGQQRERRQDQVVQAGCTLTATRHENYRFGRVQSQRNAAGGRVGGAEFRPDWCASNGGFARVQPLGCGSKAHEGVINLAGEPAIRPARYAVGLV
jgi:hypothetical protein